MSNGFAGVSVGKQFKLLERWNIADIVENQDFVGSYCQFASISGAVPTEQHIVTKARWTKPNPLSRDAAMPFSPLLEYILQLSSSSGPASRISSWAVSASHPIPKPSGQTCESESRDRCSAQVDSLSSPPEYRILFQIVGNRFCHNVGRQHKSNGVMYEVFVNRGLAYQKCWDIDCRGFRSPPQVVPMNILPDLLEFHTWCLANEVVAVREMQKQAPKEC